MKLTFTIEDNDDGGITVAMEFGEPVKANTQSTPASTLGMEVLEFISERTKAGKPVVITS